VLNAATPAVPASAATRASAGRAALRINMDVSWLSDRGRPTRPFSSF
jgi:hypothetical protein